MPEESCRQKGNGKLLYGVKKKNNDRCRGCKKSQGRGQEGGGGTKGVAQERDGRNNRVRSQILGVEKGKGTDGGTEFG